MSLDRLKSKQSIIWYEEAAFWLTLWKKSEEYGFLKECSLEECHSQLLQQKLKDLDKAFRDAFDKSQLLKRLPRFRKKGTHYSFRFPQGFKMDNRRIYLPKIGWISFFKSQKIVGKLKNVTVSPHGKHWYCSVQVEQEVVDPTHPSKAAIGIDVGIVKFAAMSNEEVVESKPSLKRKEKRLARSQRILSKKVKFSNNWKKQNVCVQKICTKIVNVRHDFLHKASTTLCKNHAMIVVEDLKIKNMSKSAKGTLDNPGRNVKAKSGLNKSILDQGWSEFFRQLEYKQHWLGGMLLKVAPQNTSITCFECGHKFKENRKSQEKFCCQSCGYKANADIDAAKNILAAGHAVLACGVKTLVSTMKQEPRGTGDLVPAQFNLGIPVF